MDPRTLLTQKITEVAQIQKYLFQKINDIQKEKSRPPFPIGNQQPIPRPNPKWIEAKAKHNLSIPSPLASSNMVEYSPWCLLCNEPHDDQDYPYYKLLTQEDIKDCEVVNTLDDFDHDHVNKKIQVTHQKMQAIKDKSIDSSTLKKRILDNLDEDKGHTRK